MRNILYGFCMADSMFCAIPSPFRNLWNEQSRPHMMLSMPVVGLKIGLLWGLLWWVLQRISFPPIVSAALLTLYPYVVTGYIHLDGFMDVTDAVKSCKDQAQRQKILKDSHVGAFAVISFGLLILLEFGLFLHGVPNLSAWELVLIPVASRCCSALAVNLLKPLSTSQYADVRKEGIRHGSVVALVVMLSAALAGAWWIPGNAGFALIATVAGSVLALMKAVKSLGGMSGDVSGYALTIGELCGVAVLVLL